MILRGILASRQRTISAKPLYWREIAALEELFQVPDYALRVRRIPSAQARTLAHLLFGLTIPRAGEESRLDAPRPLLLASVEAACRLTDSMRVRRFELSREDFLARLQREIARMASYLT